VLELRTFGVDRQEAGVFGALYADPQSELIVTVRGRIDQGKVHLTSVEVTAPRVTANTLRSIRVGDEICRTAALRFKSQVSRAASDLGDLDAEGRHAVTMASRGAALIHGTGSPKGRRPLPDEFLAEISEAYLELLADRPRSVVSALTNRYRTRRRNRHLSRNTVSGWVQKARDRGWLAGGVQGTAAGEPGPRLIEWRQKHGGRR
jgi:hypothetical protein